MKRIFVEKRDDLEAKALLADFRNNLGINISSLRIFKRYDVAPISQEVYDKARLTIFSEPNVDNCYDEHLPFTDEGKCFAVELLPGQYDQRADSCASGIQLLTGQAKPIVSYATVYLTSHDADIEAIKKYLINPVEAREASLEKPETLEQPITYPDMVKEIDGFIDMPCAQASKLCREMGLAMDDDDLLFCQEYFKSEKRNPTITEIRMIDTYWSDHCRHTTFLTALSDIEINDNQIQQAFDSYVQARKELGVGAEVTLMDIATIGAKQLKKEGYLKDIDTSDEINACSIKVDAEDEDYYVMFKNETHNHPTEIEPFGGAATCLGGAIRDPLSGRSYVYQAMRITGSADPRQKIKDTLPGRLPQRKISLGAAAGYSSYGNQIGLATGLVNEIYHPGYAAKHMELGAVIGATPCINVVRKQPVAGDVIILLGGATGRDGIGGATGSSKAHTEQSIHTCGAEVQKGNPIEERKIQRLFRNKDVTEMIKRCNDFGAGGVSVAIGELADGLVINLDAVPRKYEGLDGTELAISESQERMAVLLDKSHVDAFLEKANEENLSATVVAEVTDQNRLVMLWRGVKIVDISRDFLNTNGAKKQAKVEVKPDQNFCRKSFESIEQMLTDINIAGQEGLAQRFDGSIGAGSVIMPFGGAYQATPAQAMVAKLPILDRETDRATVMAYGYCPHISEQSPFHGAAYAVVDSVAKCVASGADISDIYLTLQEYFEKPGKDPVRWSKPFMALLGAFYAQKELKIGAIGGKDSMSGSFNDLDVPPTLVSFAVAKTCASIVVSNEFKKPGSNIYLLEIGMDKMLDFKKFRENMRLLHELISKGIVLSAYALPYGGVSEAVCKMSFGNKIGVKVVDSSACFGSVIIETDEQIDGLYKLGETNDGTLIEIGDQSIEIDRALEMWREPLSKIFPVWAENEGVAQIAPSKQPVIKAVSQIKGPRVFMPVFPGTNCEYDTQRQFEKHGAVVETLVIRNLTPKDILESTEAMAEGIRRSQIVMLAGGFSAGDQPDGSGKFIAITFRNAVIKEAVTQLLTERDGLMLGICNGFQALIKLGLLPFGEIMDIGADFPTLTHNTIGRHVSGMVSTRVSSCLSPWLANVKVGDIHTIPVSHGEGRFMANEQMLDMLMKNGQIATQYVDPNGMPTMDGRYNPNGSVCAVEGITSPCGRVFGKMGHSERIGVNIAKNIPGVQDQMIFKSGIDYYA